MVRFPVILILFSVYLFPFATHPAHGDDFGRIVAPLVGAGIKLMLEESSRRDARSRERRPQPAKPAGRTARSKEGSSALTSKQTKVAQQSLNNLGFDAGEPDGQAGGRTREAIRQYQMSIGLPATGYLTMKQYQVLVSGEVIGEPQAADEERLPTAEMAHLQRALQTLGFDIGDADGIAGSRTGAAVARFLTDRGLDPYQTSIHTAYSMIVEAAGGAVSEASAPTTMEADYVDHDADIFFDWDYGAAKYEKDRARLGRELAKRVVAVRPSIMDDKERMARWLSTFAYSKNSVWPDEQLLELQKRFSNGTEFDREEVLAALKAFLAAQASAEPLEIVRIRAANLGRYDFEREQFPLLYDKDDLAEEMTVSWSDQPYLTISAQQWPYIGLLPYPKQDAERLAKDLSAKSNRLVHIAVRMTLSDFSFENGFTAKATVRRIDVREPALGEGTQPGKLVASIPVQGQSGEFSLSGGGVADAGSLDRWRQLGVGVAGESVVFARWDIERARNVARALELFALGRMAPQSVNLYTAMYFATRFLDGPSLQNYLGREYGEFYFMELRKDPFEQKDLLERFREKVHPILASRAPKLPISVKLAWPVDIGAYDFDGGFFPLRHEIGEARDGDTLVLTPYGGEAVALRADIGNLPVKLSRPENEARQLHQRLQRKDPSTGERRLYAALDLHVEDLVARMNGGSDLPVNKNFGSGMGFILLAKTLRPTLVLYEDPGLTRTFAEIAVDVMQPAEPIAEEPEPGKPAPEGLRLNRWNILTLAADLGAGGDLMEAAIQASAAYKDADSADRGTVLQQMKATATKSYPDGRSSLFLNGNVTIGQVDEAGFAPVAALNLLEQPDQSGRVIDDGLVALSFDNASELMTLPLSATTAQDLKQSSASGIFPALLEVRPVRSKRLNGDKPIAELTLAVEKIFLLHPQATDRVIALFDIEEPSKPSGATAGGSPPNSRFEVLGVRLGMPIEDARKLIKEHVASGTATPLEETYSNFGSLTVCEAIKIKSSRSRQSKEQLNDALRKENCPIREDSPMVFSFGYDLKLTDKLTERIVIYRTGENLGPAIVSAVYRQFSPDSIGTLLEDGLPRQYGDDFVVPNSAGQTRVWVDVPSQRALFKENSGERCVPFWPGDGGYPSRSLLLDCGAFLRADKYRMILMDTRFASRVVRETAAARKPDAVPEIKF